MQRGQGGQGADRSRRGPGRGATQRHGGLATADGTQRYRRVSLPPSAARLGGGGMACGEVCSGRDGVALARVGDGHGGCPGIAAVRHAGRGWFGAAREGLRGSGKGAGHVRSTSTEAAALAKTAIGLQKISLSPLFT